jgi:hypothetical protein
VPVSGHFRRFISQLQLPKSLLQSPAANQDILEFPARKGNILQAVIDNSSRKILAWTVSARLDPSNTCQVLLAAQLRTQVVARASRRILRFLQRRGVITLVTAPGDGEVTVVPDETLGEQDPLLTQLLAAVTIGAAPAGPATKRRPVRIVLDPDDRPVAKGELCARAHGFNLHAATRVATNDKPGRERLCRYILRPPLANDRLHILPEGAVRLGFKKPWSDGTASVDLQPLAFIARLAALVPPPRRHLTRYVGVLSSHSGLRSQVVPKPSTTANAAGADRLDSPAIKSRYVPWAELLRRTFAIDIQCAKCGRFTSGPLSTRELPSPAGGKGTMSRRKGPRRDLDVPLPLRFAHAPILAGRMDVMSPHATSFITAGLLACTSSCAPTFMRDADWNDIPPPAACEVIETTHSNGRSSVVRFLYDPAGRLVFGIRENLDSRIIGAAGRGTAVERLTWQGLDLVAAEYLEERPAESCDVCKCYGAGCASIEASRTIERADLAWHGHRLSRVRHTRSDYSEEAEGWRLDAREVSAREIARSRASARAAREPRIEWYQGRVSAVDYGKGQNTTFGYDELGRCVSERRVTIEQKTLAGKLDGATGIVSVPEEVTQALTRQYDQDGKLLLESETVTHSLSVGEGIRTETRYGYDSVGRAVSISTEYSSGPATVASSTTRKLTTYSDGCPARVGALTEAEGAVNSVPAKLGLMDCYTSPGRFYVACFERD